MVRTTIRLEGMACPMCESHVNDALRNALPVKKATSSHGKGRAVVLSEEAIPEGAIREALAPTGYRVLSVESEPCARKGLFGKRG